MNITEFDPGLLIIGAAVIITLLFFYILFLLSQKKKQQFVLRGMMETEYAYQQEILKAQLETQQQTFFRVGEELHDNVGQLLSSSKILLGITERSLQEVPDTLRTTDQTISKALQEIRTISKSLEQDWLNHFNFIDQLERETSHFNSLGNAEMKLIYAKPEVQLNPESQVMLFRIVQEILQHCIRTSSPRLFTISVKQLEDLRVVLRHNEKCSIDIKTNTGIPGLVNMHHRLKLLNGKISWRSEKEEGTEITIQIPLQKI
ncbi:MAG: sensor histidine kinase [Flavitalea sp.]